ncbi:MAG: DNA-binding GntR family transcriptional regulator [Gammaproteobacteria bacterium]|jgi:DNA-binding GntR family transcriptional regulator
MVGSPANSKKQKNAKGFGAVKIYETLRDEIISLVLEPGQLIDETSLATRFNVSRSPVREALVRLVTESLLQTLPNKGTIVAPLRIEEFPQYVDALDLLQRSVTRLAAKNRDANDLKQINLAQDKFIRCVESNDVRGMILCNRDFHAAIAKAGKNRYLEQSYCQVLDDGLRSLRLYFKSFGDVTSPDIPDGHLQIIRAIENQDEDLAESLARAHTEEMQARFLDYLGTRHITEISLTR